MEFIAPTLCVLLGAAMVLLAPVSRYLSHLSYIGFAFLLIGVALFMDIGGHVSDKGASGFLNDILYVIAAQLLVQGATRKSGRTFPYQWHVSVFVLLTSAIAWFGFVQPDLVHRVYVLDIGFGVILLAGAWRIHATGGRSIADRILFWTILISGLHFFPRTFMTAYSYVSPDAASGQTKFWIVLSLSVAILVSIGTIAFLVSAGIEVIQTLKRERDIDPLTGLYNRRAFLEEADRALVGRHGVRPATLVMVDLDYFKQVNDCFGHATGDAVLTELAGLLQDFTSNREIVGRYGGEEFMIVVGADLDSARELADRIRERIASHDFLALPDGYRLTASFGVAEIDRAAGIGPAIERADAMLYGSKEDGRNKVRVDRGADIIRLADHAVRKVG